MALFKCPHCGEKISDTSTRCIFCGNEIYVEGAVVEAVNRPSKPATAPRGHHTERIKGQVKFDLIFSVSILVFCVMLVFVPWSICSYRYSDNLGKWESILDMWFCESNYHGEEFLSVPVLVGIIVGIRGIGNSAALLGANIVSDEEYLVYLKKKYLSIAGYILLPIYIIGSLFFVEINGLFWLLLIPVVVGLGCSIFGRIKAKKIKTDILKEEYYEE